MICAKPFSPLPNCSAADMYGLDGLFSLKMPDPEKESGEPVNTYYTLLHTFVVPKKLAVLQEIYKIQCCRPPQERNGQVLQRCPQAWDEVLALKGTTPVAVQSGRDPLGQPSLPWMRIFPIMNNKFDVILGASV